MESVITMSHHCDKVKQAIMGGEIHLLLSPKRKRSCKSTSSKKTASNHQPNSTQSFDSTTSPLSSPVGSPGRLPTSYDDTVLCRKEASCDSQYEIFLKEREMHLSKTIGATTPPSSYSSRYHTRSMMNGSSSTSHCIARSGLKSDSPSTSLLSPSPESSPESSPNFGRDDNEVKVAIGRTLPGPFIEIVRLPSKKPNTKTGNIGNNGTVKCLRSSLGAVRNQNQNDSISTESVLCASSIFLGDGSIEGRGKRGRGGSFPTNVSKTANHHTFICPGSADLRPKMDDWVSSFEGESDDEKSSNNSSVINQKWSKTSSKKEIEFGKRRGHGGHEKIHGYGLRSSKSSLYRGSGSDDDQLQNEALNEHEHDTHHQISNLSDSNDFEGKLSELHVGRRSRTIFGDSSILSFNTDFPDETTSFVDALINSNSVDNIHDTETDMKPLNGREIVLGSCSSENVRLKEISHDAVSTYKTLSPKFVSEISRSLDRLGSISLVVGNPFTNTKTSCSSSSSSACPSNTKSSITSCHSGLSSSCTSNCPSPLNYPIQRMYGSIPRSLQSSVHEENVKITKSDFIGERGGVRRGVGAEEFEVPKSRLLWSPEKEVKGSKKEIIERRETKNILYNKEEEKYSVGQGRNIGFDSPKKVKYVRADSGKSKNEDNDDENGNENINDSKPFIGLTRYGSHRNDNN